MPIRTAHAERFVATTSLVLLAACDPIDVEPRRDHHHDPAPAASSAADDPLPSWNDGVARSAIVDFVTRVTQDGPDFVPVDQRIATFDNDGTLWSERPIYVQLAFAIDRVRQLAPDHPEWQDQEPFKAVLEEDMAALLASGERGAVDLLAATHAGTTSEQFAGLVERWIATARHPRFGRPYTDLVYAPMLELLEYLRAHDFKTFIVSGGGVEFMRPWAERAYGIPPEQVVGSRLKMKYEQREGRPVLWRLGEVDHVDDGPGKPVGIQQAIGRRPIAAFGNSDGDFEMLEWTTSGPGPRMGMIVHHTDAAREFAYDREGKVGRLQRALDEAPARGWIVASMKDDWRVVFSFER